MTRLKFKQLSFLGPVLALLFFFQNCGDVSYVAPKPAAASNSEASVSPPPPAATPPNPQILLALSAGTPTGSATVKGTIQIVGSASANWSKVTVSDARQPALWSSTTPVDGRYSVNFDTTKMADGLGKLLVVASAPTGETKQVDLPVLVHNATGAIPLLSVNAGGPAFGSFLADNGFAGGNSVNILSYLVGIAGDARYDTARAGNFSYAFTGFPPNTPLAVTFYFAEILGATPGVRTFNIAINGSVVKSSYDIVVAAGGSYTATKLDFTFNSDANGNVNFQFTGVKGAALLSGFQVFAP